MLLNLNNDSMKFSCELVVVIGVGIYVVLVSLLIKCLNVK